jgi:hypothetical protein
MLVATAPSDAAVCVPVRKSLVAGPFVASPISTRRIEQSGHAAETMSMSRPVSASPSSPLSCPVLAPPVSPTCAKHGFGPTGFVVVHLGRVGRL